VSMEFKFDSSRRKVLPLSIFTGTIPADAHISGGSVQIQSADPILAQGRGPRVKRALRDRCPICRQELELCHVRSDALHAPRRSFCDAAHLRCGLTLPAQLHARNGFGARAE